MQNLKNLLGNKNKKALNQWLFNRNYTLTINREKFENLPY